MYLKYSNVYIFDGSSFMEHVEIPSTAILETNYVDGSQAEFAR
jgi:hypothetical protein